jgi:hypothetical protein
MNKSTTTKQQNITKCFRCGVPSNRGLYFEDSLGKQTVCHACKYHLEEKTPNLDDPVTLYLPFGNLGVMVEELLPEGEQGCGIIGVSTRKIEDESESSRIRFNMVIGMKTKAQAKRLCQMIMKQWNLKAGDLI